MAILHPAYLSAVSVERDPTLVVTRAGRSSVKPCLGDICTPADFFDWYETAETWASIALAVLPEESGRLFPLMLSRLKAMSLGSSEYAPLVEGAVDISREASKAAFQVLSQQPYVMRLDWVETAATIPDAEVVVTSAKANTPSIIKLLQEAGSKAVDDVKQEADKIVEDVKSKMMQRYVMYGLGAAAAIGIAWMVFKKKK